MAHPQPFARLKAIMVMYAVAARLDGALKIQALASIPAYRSRGHGGRYAVWQRQCTGRVMRDRSKYVPAAEDRKHRRVA